MLSPVKAFLLVIPAKAGMTLRRFKAWCELEKPSALLKS
jgi:hypothetical protein